MTLPPFYDAPYWYPSCWFSVSVNTIRRFHGMTFPLLAASFGK
jgi:hypothetical protein